AVATTTETEMQMGMGLPVAARVKASGGLPALGIDITSNYSGDMFAQMRLFMQTQRALENHVLEERGLTPGVIRLKARDVLEFATIGGARAIGLDAQIGSLTPGKAADIALIRADGIGMVPAPDAVGAIVLYANAGDVDSVFVAGRPIKRRGAMLGVDWPTVRARLLTSTERLYANGAWIPLSEIEPIWRGGFHFEGAAPAS
ncbi:MAG: amidohydrolase family protein, partial [Alphaproteobacteria bacterium]|nr:amidohydrolase family protein [Alphaproteobacteria bacterium]